MQNIVEDKTLEIKKTIVKNKYAQVIVNIANLDLRTFSYIIPDELRDIIKIGQPVLVPFGTQGVINAFIVGFGDYLPEGIRAKSIYEILDPSPVFDLEHLKFLEWVSSYYCCSLPAVIEAALPMNFFAKSKRIAYLVNKDVSMLKLTKNLEKVFNILLSSDEMPVATLQKRAKLPSSKFYEALRKLKKHKILDIKTVIKEKSQKQQYQKTIKLIHKENVTKRQLELLNQLESIGSECLIIEFEKKVKTTRATLLKLEKIGNVEIIENEVYRNPLKIFENEEREAFPELNFEQKMAFARVEKAIDEQESDPLLLHGITGSGKTEVYFNAIKKTLSEGKTVVFLAPEIPIASQLAQRLARRFGTEEVAIWHSSVSEGEKFDVWQRLKSGKIRIIIGARSAIFAPIKNLGLIVIDEEHESTYKQTSPNPRYNAKTLAEKRAQNEKATLVLGSATPDISTYYKALNTNRIISLTERFGKSNLAKAIVVDMKQELGNANRSLFSRILKESLTNNLAQKKQSILLINRRGFATTTLCQGCGETVECQKCAIPLILHKPSGTLRCHYCNYERGLITICPTCGSDAIRYYGVGTQKVEEAAKRAFPDAIIARMDSDILSKKNAHIEVLNSFLNGEIDILIGTQMIAKGLDNPNVTIVGVLLADSSFNLPDYRASERGFQLLTQVAGRAGRGDFEGKVFFQTYAPDFFAIENAKQQDYNKFYKEEIKHRLELDYPPYSQIIRLIISSENNFKAERMAQEVAMRLKDLVNAQGIVEKLEINGPASCVIAKIKDEYRFQIIIKNRIEEKGHFMITSFIKKLSVANDVKVLIDVDPTDML